MLSEIKLRLLLGLALSLLLFSSASALNSYPNTKVLTSDSKGISFLYQAPEPSWEKMHTENGVFDRVTLPQCGVTEETGKPELPVKVILIGVPLDAGIRVHTQILQSSVVNDVRIVPVPKIIKDKDSEVGYRLSYEPLKEVYGKATLFPSQPVKWDDPGFLRHQKVVRVYIYPFQFNPQRREVIFNKEVKVSISFPKAKGQFTRFNYRDGFESAYKAVVLNYQQAKRWRGNPLFKVSPKLTTENPFYLSSDWYKMEIKEEGIYKIDKSTLRKVDLDGVNPSTIRIFTSSSCGKMLPRGLSATPPTLEEVAIYIEGESDGRLDDSDYILFYGQPTTGWRFDRHTGEFSYYTNLFTDENVYWLTYGGDFSDPPLRMQAIEGSPQASNPYEPKSFRDRIHREMDKINKSIDRYDDNLYSWYWKHDSYLEDYLSLSGVVTGDTGMITSSPPETISVIVNGSLASREGSIFRTTDLKDGLNHLEFNFGGTRYINYYEVEYGRRFEAKDGILKFPASNTAGPVKYSVSGFSQTPHIFDISNPFRVKRIVNPSFSANTLTFETTSSDTSRGLYYLASEGNLKKVRKLERVEIAGLRDTTNLANYIIITYDDFYEQVQPLKDLREKKEEDSLYVKIVKVSEVYNEFSWGLFDPTAIRDFLRYAFLHWNQKFVPEYVLLVGDGNYDYKNNTRSAPPQYIPPWEESARTKCTDDNYVNLGGDKYLDMIPGRLPVRSQREAEIVVNKIINYENSSTFGPWRKVIVGVADDEFGANNSETTHTINMENLIENKVPKDRFDVQKIYLMNYKRVGRSVPEAQQLLMDAYNRGALIIDFIGHGNYRVWAHESVFDSYRDIPKLHNGVKLPLVYSASCQVGFFDHTGNECISEKLVRAEGKGAIAAISATRASLAGENEPLNMEFCSNLLKSSESLGFALYNAKGWIVPGPKTNSSLYLILGDPALRLGPQLKVDSLTASPDSLCALSEMIIKGKVFDRGDNFQDDFDGIVHLTVYDSKYWGSHYVVEAEKTIRYLLPGRAIFRGQAEVKAGKFEMSFFVPKDISYQGNMARISAYVYNAQIDGAGALDNIKVAGTATGVEDDTTGPTINIEFAGQTFQSGDLVVSQPTLKVHIYDEHGINLTKVVGHGITLQVDESQDLLDLTNYFQYDLNSPQGGSLEYTLPALGAGRHTITLRAWDSYNNPAEKRVEFAVVSSDKLVITDLMNYPNPFKKKTYFSYQLSLPSQVDIQIFTLAGRLIKTIKNAPGKVGYNLQPWDGLDGDGDRIANGVYIYKVVARSNSLKADAYGKAVVMK